MEMYYLKMWFKRVWLWRLRSRSHIRPALLVVVCLAASIFVFDSALTARSTDGRHFSYPEQSHAITTDSAQALPLQNPHRDVSQVKKPHNVITATPTRHEIENDFHDTFEAYIVPNKTTEETFSNEGFDILSQNVQKHNEESEESSFILSKTVGKHNEESIISDTKKSGKESPSFGFVNKAFKSPPPRQERGGGLIDALQGFVKGGSLLSPGSLLGAVAALKQFETVRYPQSKDELRADSKAPRPGIADVPETHFSVSNDKEKQSDAWKGNEKDSSKSQFVKTQSQGEKDQPLSHVQIPSHPRSDENIRKGTSGVKSSPLGHNRSPGGSVLGSLMSNLAPMLLSGRRTKNDRQMEGSGGVSQSNNLQGLIGGLGPLFLAGFGGLGGLKGDSGSPSNSGKWNSLHTIMSQVGSTLMTEAALHPDSHIPIQSLLSNFGPALLSTFTQGDTQNTGRKGTANSNPVQAILGGLLPVLMSSVSQQGARTNNMDTRNPSPQSPIQAIVSGIGQSIMKKETGLGGFLAGMAPVLMAGAPRRGSRTLQGTEVDADTESDYNSITSASHEHLQQGGGGLDGGGAAVRLMVQGAMSLLPEEVSVPEINSTRSLWDMAVNLAFGNPRDSQGNNSRFWQWVKAYIDESPGSNRNTEDFTPAWITAALKSKGVQRQANPYTLTLSKVYQRLQEPQSSCQHIRSVGGLFNWKTGVLSNAKDVCMDVDVAPRSKGCIVYSFGIRDKWNFEEDMEDMGCEVWAFDPTMTTGNHNHSSAIHFYNLGLASSSAPVTITKEGQSRHLFPLAEVMDRLGHATSTIDYLKLDVGGSEWQVLHETAKHNPHALTNLRQLGVEVHLEAALRDPSQYSLYLDVLEGLESLGFQLFSSRVTQKRGWSYHESLLGRRVSLHYDLVFLRV